jgi:hypothetical protein
MCDEIINESHKDSDDKDNNEYHCQIREVSLYIHFSDFAISIAKPQLQSLAGFTF